MDSTEKQPNLKLDGMFPKRIGYVQNATKSYYENGNKRTWYYIGYSWLTKS